MNDSVWRFRLTWLAGSLLVVGAGLQWTQLRSKTESDVRVESMLARLETPFHEVQHASHFCDVRFERAEFAPLLAELQPARPGGHASILHGGSEVGKSYAVCAALEGQTGVVHLNMRNLLKERFIEDLAPQIGCVDSNGERFLPTELPATVQGLVRQLLAAVDAYRQAHSGARVRIIIEDIHTCVDRNKLNRATRRQLHDAAAALLGALVQPLRDGRINVLFTVSELADCKLIQQESGMSRTRVVAFPSIDDANLEQQLPDCASGTTRWWGCHSSCSQSKSANPISFFPLLVSLPRMVTHACSMTPTPPRLWFALSARIWAI